jgi:hypothetical protein
MLRRLNLQKVITVQLNIGFVPSLTCAVFKRDMDRRGHNLDCCMIDPVSQF